MELKERIKKEIRKIKILQRRYGRMSVARLKSMKGFANVTDEVAEKIIRQLEEYADIVVRQMNRVKMNKLNLYGQGT